jgi:D-alanyl-D-alanine dipeptidase
MKPVVSRDSKTRVLVILIFLVLNVPALSAQPRELGAFRKPDLVEIVHLDTTIHLDIRYATAGNFMNRPMYRVARAFLQRPAAEALLRVHRRLRSCGFGIVVFDGYRPWSVTKLFWDATPREKRKFVANPARGSKHNRGCAVDLSLYEIASGHEVAMPSPYDDFTEKASPKYRGGSQEARAMRDLLRNAMEKEGFTVDGNEWWHFDYRDWKKYRILNVPFEQVSTPPLKKEQLQ